MRLSSILHQFSIRDLFAQYGAATLVAAASFFLTGIIARRIGAEQFGLYSAALSVGSILGIFLDFGFKQIVQREAARSGLLLSFRLLQGISIQTIFLFAVLFVAGSVLSFETHSPLAFAIALCFSGAALTQLISAGLRGQKRFVQDAWHQVASRSISAVFITAALLFWPNIEVIIGAWGVGTVAWAIYAFNTFSKPEFGAPSLSIYKHATPLFIIELLIVVHFRIDLIAMQAFGVDKHLIGNFSAALRIVELFIFLTFPMRSMLLTQIRHENNKRLHNHLLARCTLAVITALVLSAGVSFLAPWIIYAVFGDGYGQAIPLLRIMVWLLVPSFVLAIVFETSIATNRESAYRTAAMIVLMLNLVSLVLLLRSGSYLLIAPLKVALESVFCIAALSFLLYHAKGAN